MAFTGAKRKPLTEEADGSGAGLARKGRADKKLKTGIHLSDDELVLLDLWQTTSTHLLEESQLCGYILRLAEVAEADADQTKALPGAEVHASAKG